MFNQAEQLQRHYIWHLNILIWTGRWGDCSTPCDRCYWCAFVFLKHTKEVHSWHWRDFAPCFQTGQEPEDETERLKTGILIRLIDLDCSELNGACQCPFTLIWCLTQCECRKKNHKSLSKESPKVCICVYVCMWVGDHICAVKCRLSECTVIGVV